MCCPYPACVILKAYFHHKKWGDSRFILTSRLLMTVKLCPIKSKGKSPLKIAKLFQFQNCLSHVFYACCWLIVWLKVLVVYAMHDWWTSRETSLPITNVVKTPNILQSFQGICKSPTYRFENTIVRERCHFWKCEINIDYRLIQYIRGFCSSPLPIFKLSLQVP